MPDDRLFHRRAGHSEKVNHLNDLEFRVWFQYVLSADDFGVMRFSAVTLQADNDHLSNRPSATVMRCLKAVKDRGLIRTFTHQNREYAYQHDWQDWQKINYPRTTNHPAPPSEALLECSADTQELFSIHPGGAGRKRKERSENVSETVPNGSSLMRGGAPAKRLTANGSEGGLGETPIDVCAQKLLELYPKQGACSLHAVTVALGDVLRGKPAGEFQSLLERLEGHKRSAKWLDQGGRFIPRLDRYLSSGTHQQTMPPPEATRTDPTDAILEANDRKYAHLRKVQA